MDTAQEEDTGVKLYACYDRAGKRRTGFYSLPTEAQLFCQSGWQVEELEVRGKRKPRPA
jgi:hypothetical protein